MAEFIAKVTQIEFDVGRQPVFRIEGKSVNDYVVEEVTCFSANAHRPYS